jgi:hypothetical protein
MSASETRDLTTPATKALFKSADGLHPRTGLFLGIQTFLSAATIQFFL